MTQADRTLIDDRVRGASLLIVDDNPVNVELLRDILQSSGYTNVHATTDSAQVMSLFQQTRFDLVLLDIRMPKYDGFAVMGQLSSLIADDYLPVIVITAQADKSTRIRSLEVGAKDFITKPFDRVEVLNRIRNMLEMRVLYNERGRQAAWLEETVRQRTHELERRASELRETQLEIVRCLGRAGEYRDNETGLHVLRMSKCCERLARAAGLGDRFAEMLLYASPMHDVGKIGIPDRILLKPGPLDPDEWELMKTHTLIGAEIIGQHSSEVMQLAREITLTHHEHWDGCGYPRGLSGAEIPLVGRIAAVCDVFDALTSERAYKAAWPIEDAVQLVNDNAGKQFDPHLVELFNKILPEFLEIKQRYLDRNN